MKTKSLHSVFRQAINQFGIGILTESRLANILLDYSAYADVPAAKTIIQAMVAGGYGQKIIDLGKQKRSFLASLMKSNPSIGKPEGDEWINKLKTYSSIISKQNGFQQPLVDYVIGCMVYGLDWIDDAPEIPQANKPAQDTPHDIPLGPQPIKTDVGRSSGTNTNKTNSISYQNVTDSQFLVMTVSPKYAEVYVDGKQQYVSNGVMAVELPVGTHTYEVRASSYETETGTVNIDNQIKSTLDVFLKLNHKTIKLTVETTDSDADIFINGTCYGKGRLEGLVDEGTYEIEGRKHRYYPLKKTVTLQGREQEHVLIPSLVAKYGNLKVNIQPYGSTIIINGVKEGTTPLLVNKIVIGERRLTIKTDEGTEYSTTVEIRENQTTEVNHIIPSLFLEDYSQVRIGDYFYEDGTFSHVFANGKQFVGMVFSLETSEEEKARGWTHGQIIASKDASNSVNNKWSWGLVNDTILKYAISNPKGFFRGRDIGYLMSHLECVENNPDFVPFNIAAQHKAPLPFGKTSGWYLPCAVQWRTLYINTHNRWEELWKVIKITGSHGAETYATSSIVDRTKAWKFTMGLRPDLMDQAYKAEDIQSGWGIVRPVASF